LALALNYPVQPGMVNDGTGIVFGEDQYQVFARGLWSPEPYEVMIIFESLNEGAIDGLPQAGAAWAEFSGLCDKLMILHPGKYCPPHFHPRKTESYEIVLGEMDLFYGPTPIPDPTTPRLAGRGMARGEPWPVGVELPAGREASYADLTSYTRLRHGDPKFVMHRRHLHAFRCPPDAATPLVVREVSTYSHEPTEANAGQVAPLAGWAGIHDNEFVHPGANTGRLGLRITD
jgi:hypothetical protein